jgi:hypothetical protein
MIVLHIVYGSSFVCDHQNCNHYNTTYNKWYIDRVTVEVGQKKYFWKYHHHHHPCIPSKIGSLIVLHLSYKNLIVHDVWCKIWDADTVITFYLIVEFSTIVLQWWWWWWWHFSKIIFVIVDATKNLRHQNVILVVVSHILHYTQHRVTWICSLSKY